jgi:hypothetical protein
MWSQMGYHVMVCDHMAFHGDYRPETMFPNSRVPSRHDFQRPLRRPSPHWQKAYVIRPPSNGSPPTVGGLASAIVWTQFRFLGPVKNNFYGDPSPKGGI